MSKKITLATVKRFIKKHGAALQISKHSAFDGMTDGIAQSADRKFYPVKAPDFQGKPFRPAPGQPDHYLGIAGAWFVFQSRDHFSEYAEGGMVGIKVDNCCGRFVLAVPAAPAPSPLLDALVEKIEEPEQAKVQIVDCEKAGLINGPFMVLVSRGGKLLASTSGIQGPTGAAGVARNYCGAYNAVMA